MASERAKGGMPSWVKGFIAAGVVLTPSSWSS